MHTIPGFDEDRAGRFDFEDDDSTPVLVIVEPDVCIECYPLACHCGIAINRQPQQLPVAA